jgi:glutamine synthetase
LSPNFVKVFTSVKEVELNEYLTVISPWEREHLLLNV